MQACDFANFGSIDSTREDVAKAWHAPFFNLKTDAWAIVTRQGQLVGYADVRQSRCRERLVCFVRIHPRYRGRGIGTLFTLLIEERARQLACNAHPRRRVTLSVTVCVRNRSAQRLLEREGYMSVNRFWRLSITDGDTQETLTADLNVEAQDLFDESNLVNRTGFYVARQYEVFEKELRPDADECSDGDQSESHVTMEPLTV
jgi:ribosomal protein S18 acetylase RimI-like enzyme